MSNSGPNEDDEIEMRGRDMSQNGKTPRHHLANVLAKKVVDTDDEDAGTDHWFEELMQQFY